MNSDYENFDDFEFDENEEEIETLTIVDDESGEEIELMVINKLKYKEYTYYLVLEAEFMDDDGDEEEPEATILKEVPDGAGDFFYEPILDDAEFDAVAELFRKNSGEDYDIGD